MGISEKQTNQKLVKDSKKIFVIELKEYLTKCVRMQRISSAFYKWFGFKKYMEEDICVEWNDKRMVGTCEFFQLRMWHYIVFV